MQNSERGQVDLRALHLAEGWKVRLRTLHTLPGPLTFPIYGDYMLHRGEEAALFLSQFNNSCACRPLLI